MKIRVLQTTTSGFETVHVIEIFEFQSRMLTVVFKYHDVLRIKLRIKLLLQTESQHFGIPYLKFY